MVCKSELLHISCVLAADPAVSVDFSSICSHLACKLHMAWFLHLQDRCRSVICAELKSVVCSICVNVQVAGGSSIGAGLVQFRCKVHAKTNCSMISRGYVVCCVFSASACGCSLMLHAREAASNV